MRDLIFPDMFQLHHECAKTVAMRYYQYVLTFLQAGLDVPRIIRDHPCGRISQTFAAGRTNGVASPPDAYLLFAIFPGGLCLIKALELSVVTFVQRFVPGHR